MPYFKKSSFQRMVLLGTLLLGGISNASVGAMERTEETTGEEKSVVKIVGVTDQTIAESLGSYENISSLDLSSNKLSSTLTLPTVVDAIREKAPHLTSLRWTHGELGNQSVKVIAEALTHLVSFNVQTNGIIFGKKSENPFASLRNLTDLDLSDNKIGDGGVSLITKDLPGLTALNLKRCGVTGKGMQAIRQNLPGLTSLNVSWNNLGNPGIKELGHLENLTDLNLSGVGISAEGVPSILQLTTLKKLDVRQISGKNVNEVKEALKGQFPFALTEGRCDDEQKESKGFKDISSHWG